MIHFFGNQSNLVFAVQSQNELSSEDSNKLNWLFGDAHKIEKSVVADFFVGPRAAMITPWSTNAVEITQNMGITNYIKETRAEMGHVNWPTRNQTVNFTLLVIAVSVVVAALLGISDFVFSKLLTLLF